MHQQALRPGSEIDKLLRILKCWWERSKEMADGSWPRHAQSRAPVLGGRDAPIPLRAKGALFTGERCTPTWMLAESAKDYVVLALGKLFSDCFVSGRQAKEVSPGV